MSQTQTDTPRAWQSMDLPAELVAVLEKAPAVHVPDNANELRKLALRDVDELGYQQVKYEVEGKGEVLEATVCATRNGYAANYPEPYMRRRDPNCMLIGDELPTNKPKFNDHFDQKFADIRQETFDWLGKQELILFPFVAGIEDSGLSAVAVVPVNAGFFALGLAMLQGMCEADQMKPGFKAQAVVYVAPPFRHTHFDGKQIVVHNRLEQMHELFSYNLYPGPSAKKGIYGMLINMGEQQGWVTAHCSTVRVTTPYDNEVVFMHEGASGGGKSEMLEPAHREKDGRLLLGENVVTGEKRHVALPRACELSPVTDDMAICRSARELGPSGKLQLADAENAWFIRVNHIDAYGVDPHLERLTVMPPEPLLFLNIDAVPNSRALIFEHIEDEPGTPCPNPRVVVPRRLIPGIVDGPVNVDIRSFGVRTPPCTKEQPDYGIIGIFHLLPPALAWLWRLVAPRGHANPSIVDSAAMSSEGVGSYWPFATGRRIDQANLLLEQIVNTPQTTFILMPNQHVGAWKVGFMPQWVAREYLARRGVSRFRDDAIEAARCPLLGYTPKTIQVEGQVIGHWFLQVESQPEVGPVAYDRGAEKLYDFFREQLAKFDEKDLMPLGRQIIDCCLDGGTVQQYEQLIARRMA